MVRKIFGTDGIRGKVNTKFINAEFMQKLGIACGKYFLSKSGQEKSNRVIIGKDTRRSGYMLETALTSGFTSIGMDVFLLGPIPTPAVGMLTRSMRADLGVMISASHNHFEDNGIKFFGPDGFKLSDFVEKEIELLLTKKINLVEPSLVGRVKRIDEVLGRYTEAVKKSLPKTLNLRNLTIVIDCANGSAYKCAPQILWELGANVIPLGVDPNGYNINLNCGSTNTSRASKLVKEYNADLAICLDGDADRVIILDERGKEIDGDQLIALIAKNLKNENKINGNTVVSTVMSNLGLQKYLANLGLNLHRTPVGDRYVAEIMKNKGFNFGGEKSGHIIMSDYASTGDGLLAALHFLSILKNSRKTASELLNVFKPIPQKLVNLKFKSKTDPLENSDVKNTINKLRSILSDSGEILVRKSGTEPVIRIMIQHNDNKLIKKIINNLSEIISEL
ncbi:MAG: phosphoglucosamine mutase [Paracoccaceae bacterium]